MHGVRIFGVNLCDLMASPSKVHISLGNAIKNVIVDVQKLQDETTKTRVWMRKTKKQIFLLPPGHTSRIVVR
jgi:hypothetical protein